MRTITVKEIEHIAFSLASETLSFDEPIPEFGTRYPNILESCLAVPFQSFGKKALYPSFFLKASILFYLMIKNHPFQNSNKRIAITTLFVFLSLNKKWLKVNIQELYNFTVWVASSPPKVKDETVKAVEKFIRTYVVRV